MYSGCHNRYDYQPHLIPNINAEGLAGVHFKHADRPRGCQNDGCPQNKDDREGLSIESNLEG